MSPNAPEVRYLAADAMAPHAAALVRETAAACVDRHGDFALALSGGSSPLPLFRNLRDDARFPWSRTHLFFVDERCVPPHDPRSNYGFIRRELLEHIPLPMERIHRMAGEADPQEAARDYSRLLRTHAPRGLDCVVLGMGADGHTASLFPESEALHATEAAVSGPGPDVTRLTLTLPTLNAAGLALFFVAGQDKAARLQQALGSAPAAPLPVQRVQTLRRIWIVDEALRFPATA